MDLTKLQTLASKPRTFILTDILNEPDDTQSLIRYLLYANEFDTRGIVACTSVWLKDKTHPEEITRLVGVYDTVVNNLNSHVHPDHQYQRASYFLPLVSSGPAVLGQKAFDEPLSDGAQMLINRLEESGDKLYVLLWGGANTLAQALKHIRETKSLDAAARLRSRLTVYAISDQDDTGPWIRANFPDVKYIVSIHAKNMYRLATWTGISDTFDKGSNNDIVSRDWLKNNIQLGPLGSEYPNPMYIVEGDTPSFLWLIQNGLNNPERIDWGGWGGRYSLLEDGVHNNLYTDTIDRAMGLDDNLYVNNQATIWRWREAFQNDFASRIQWTMTDSFGTVSHPPIVKINGEPGPAPMLVKIKGGEELEYDASESLDPDRSGEINHLEFQWYQYWEPSVEVPIPFLPPTCSLRIEPVPRLEGAGQTLQRNNSGFGQVVSSPKVKVSIPVKDEWNDLHLILQVTNSAGKYPITRYKRVVFRWS
ncbi:hypothetical protein DER45DRAFT_577585 [Fusarium avenaceum]|nr:hypothetical protein DER45DRAFT_577585 [Fusarium avenaceum]